MRRIERVLIENFQSHERTEFRFGPGLNVIIGPSDNGKSAALRAIRWALYNEPRGTDFVRVGTRECRVTVTMSDGAEIVRELLLTRSGAVSRNRYLVALPGAEPQVFEGFGADLPVEVIRAHGMPEVQLDTDKRVLLSFGAQLEGPFLLTETGSNRAKAIGRLLGVHVVDAALRATQRDLKNARQQIPQREREVERLTRALEAFADLPDRERELEQAEARLARAEVLQSRLEQLTALRERLDRVEAQEIRLQADLMRLEAVVQAAELARQAQAAAQRAQELRRLAQALEQNDAQQRREAGQQQRAAMELDRSLKEYGRLLEALGVCPTCLQPVGRIIHFGDCFVERLKGLQCNNRREDFLTTHLHTRIDINENCGFQYRPLPFSSA